MMEQGLIRERMRFLSQEPGKLRGIRGRDLYESLQGLGLSHGQYFRALGTTAQDYCAQEFGVDLGRVTVERFFQSDPNAKWLFPDIVREAVVTGMKSKPVYPQLIVRDEPVSGTAVDTPYVQENVLEQEMHSVAEGAVIPESEITYGDRVVRLSKWGRGVIASYEVIRRMSMDMLRVHLQRIGENLGRNLDAKLADVLVNGDSSGSGTAPVSINTKTANAWSYSDLVAGFLKLSTAHGFTPTHMLADADTAASILGMSEVADSALFDFAKTGNLPTPLGVKLVPMASQPAHKLTILDANYAVQKVTEQDLLVESDKLINQQWDRTYLTVVTNFAVVYEKARVVVNNGW